MRSWIAFLLIYSKKLLGIHWLWASFFVTYLSQQPMLVGITLPFYAVHNSVQPFNAWDVLAGTLKGCQFIHILKIETAILSLAGITVAYFADTQLRSFMVENEQLAAEGKPRKQLLNTGVWYYSRYSS
jgi:steroid 5-alpha reductase family enzyme